MEGLDFREALNARYRFCYLLFKVLVSIGFVMVLGKAFSLQILEVEEWQERGRAHSETTFQIPSYRGSIYDRQGRLMAYSVPQRSLFADGELVDDPNQVAAYLAPVLGESQASLKEKLSRNRRFIWLKRQLSDHQASIIGRFEASGLYMIDEYRRFYPYRQVGGQVVGFVGLDGVGLEGMEKVYDPVLRQDSLTLGQFRDGGRRPLWLNASLPVEPDERLGIRLAIDTFIQHVCEQELEKAVLQHRARSGEIVVLNPYTFEVLAMASWPPFDPNLYDKASSDAWRNRTVTDSFEPGSTFKVFLMAAALDEGIIRKQDRIHCGNGSHVVGKRTIRDVHPYGSITIPEVLKYSSNIGSAKIALSLGGERYYNYIRAFGFGQGSGLNFPGETKGLLRHWNKWRPLDLAVIGFGQSIGVTSLQLTAGIACIANGGEYAQPLLVKELIDPQGKVVKRFELNPRRRVVRQETAHLMRDMMVGVTQQGGTGTRAALEQYSVAGKTGTAQKVDPQTGRYSSSKYNSLFTGFVPGDKPGIAMTVMISEPAGNSYGGVVAAPVFKEIAAKVLPYLGIAPSYEVKEPPLKLLWVNAPSEGSQETAKPEDGADRQNTILMPDVTGLSLKIALQQLSSLGIRAKFQGSGKVVKQSPPAGKTLQGETMAQLTLKE